MCLHKRLHTRLSPGDNDYFNNGTFNYNNKSNIDIKNNNNPFFVLFVQLIILSFLISPYFNINNYLCTYTYTYVYNVTLQFTIHYIMITRFIIILLKGRGIF